MSLQDALLKTLYDAGAVLAGIADLRDIPGSDFPFGVSVVLPLSKHITVDLLTAPTKEYHDAYHALNHQLNEIVLAGERFLKAQGYRAFAQIKDNTVHVDEALRFPLPYKTVATRAGLGWIGKNALLVTAEYGCAVRISTLFTDAPLQGAVPVTKSLCGSCTACVDACPAGALHGALWSSDTKREELVDVAVCEKKMREIMRECTGIDFDICGKCFAVCPYTQRYLRAPLT